MDLVVKVGRRHPWTLPIPGRETASSTWYLPHPIALPASLKREFL